MNTARRTQLIGGAIVTGAIIGYGAITYGATHPWVWFPLAGAWVVTTAWTAWVVTRHA